MHVTFLSLIFLLCKFLSSHVSKGANCNITQLSFNNTNGTKNLLIFTEQSFTRKGKPTYYSLYGPKDHWNQTFIQWSIKDSSWLVQTQAEKQSDKKERSLGPVFKIKKSWVQLGFPNVSDWVELWKDDKVVIKSRCLPFKNTCLAKREDELRKNSITFIKTTALGECIIPFKHENISYSSCTNVDADHGFWCATSVDVNLDWQTWGHCMDNTTCPLEGRENNI